MRNLMGGSGVAVFLAVAALLIAAVTRRVLPSDSSFFVAGKRFGVRAAVSGSLAVFLVLFVALVIAARWLASK